MFFSLFSLHYYAGNTLNVCNFGQNGQKILFATSDLLKHCRCIGRFFNNSAIIFKLTIFEQWLKLKLCAQSMSLCLVPSYSARDHIFLTAGMGYQKCKRKNVFLFRTFLYKASVDENDLLLETVYRSPWCKFKAVLSKNAFLLNKLCSLCYMRYKVMLFLNVYSNINSNPCSSIE